MSIAPIANLPYCKGLWSVISGTICRCDKDLVEDEIQNATPLLRDGLNFFKKYTEESLQNVSKKNPPPRMYDLISKLAPLLNVDATITWDLVCNFMLYEYRNCAETFASQLTDLTSMKVLIEEIWSFYYAERITLIKCLKLMVEYRDNRKHPHQKEFCNFFDEVLLGSLLTSVQKQIEHLKFINPPSRTQLFTEEHLHRIYESSLNEMRELLHIYTVILNDVHVVDSEFNNIYASISGEPRRLISYKSHEDRELMAKKIEIIQYSQTGLLLVAFDVTKHIGMEDWIKGVGKIMQDTFEHKCLRDSLPQDGPLLLAWMLANYAIEPENTDILNCFRPFGIRAIQMNVFHYLKGLLDSEMIREDTHYAEIVRSSVYNLLTLLCAFIDEDRLDTLTGIFDTVASILRYPKLAERFWREKEDGLWVFYKYAAQWFPYRFEPLTAIVTGLASASILSAKNVIYELDNLPSLTLEVTRQNLHTIDCLKPYEQECVIHRNSFRILTTTRHERIESARRRNDGDEFDVILWHTKGSYWHAFHHKIEQLFLQASGGMASLSYKDAVLPEQVTQGFALLEALLATDMEIPRNMVIPTELSFEIVNRFSYATLPLNIYKVVASCIRVSSKLVLRYPEDVLSRMRTEVYPRFDDRYQKTTEFAEAVSFDGGLIASWLSSIETIQHTYPILNAYLDTLSNYLIARHSKEAMYSVEIPGMVLLLQSILPKLDSWYFQSESEKVELWLKSIFCLHRALDSVPEGESRNELKLIVTYNLLHLEPRHALLKIVRTSERALRNRMMNETDWIAGKGFKVIKSVQLALSVVNRLLMYRKNLGLGIEERSPLEIALYASPSLPNGLLIVPTIVDYLYVWFSPALQAMAVRLLKKFAEGFSMSLLVCMGMDGTAIRETFASRLMSPTCAAEVKVAILELVAVCLDRQPGLTEALFNIMHQAERKRIFPRPADEFLTEGCTQFLDLYMQRIFHEDNIVYDRLYDSTMSLLRAIWYHRNEILVNFFRKKTEFWSHLFAPLFRNLVTNVKGYSQLIDIVTLELFKSTLLEKDFQTNLEKLLDTKENYWGKLVKYIFKTIPTLELSNEDDGNVILEKDDVKPFYETILESLYQFLVTITDERVAKKYPIDEKQARETTSLALDHLLELLKQPTPKSSAKRISMAKTTMLLASITLRCISSWKLKCITNSSDLKNKLRELVHEIAQFYRGYGRSLRQTLISLVLGCIQLIGDILIDDNVTLDYLLGQSCILAIGDVEELRELARSREKKRKFINEDGREKLDRVSEDLEAMELSAISESLPATLTVSVITQLLNYQIEYNRKSQRRKSASLQLGQLISEIMTTIGVTMQKHPYAKFSKVALALLGTAVRSVSGSFKFEEETVVKLWLTLIPPPDLKNSVLASLYDDCSSMSIWRCQDWWPLYTIGLEFIIGLIISESSSAYISFVITFLGSHEYQLMEVSTLLRHTADPAAADLIQSLISLVSTLSTKPVYWDSIQPNVRETLVKCTYLAYDSTVNLLLRPRILKFIMDGISVESAEELQTCDEKQLSGELKLLVNKLILINTSCAMSFVYFSPRLNTLVDTIYCQEDFWYAPMAEMNFGPPQMCITSGPQLTYGTIISSTQLFTQAQLHVHSTKTPSSSTISTLSNTVIRPSTSRDEKIDLAKKEWERASPENLRRMQVKDLRKILHQTGSSAPVGSSLISNLSSGIDFSGFLTGQDVTVSLLSNPRLIRRPFDPLICENTILSRATALIPISSRSHVGKNNTTSSKNDQDVLNRSRNDGNGGTSDPWFASMEENNTRLALEVNLVLILCQALEGVKSPRLALRDRQLIARETATEIGVFFDFLEQKNFTDWQVSATLIEADSKKLHVVEAPDVFSEKLTARLKKNCTIQKTPVNSLPIVWEEDDDDSISVFEQTDEPEQRSNDDIVTSGGFGTKIVTMKFLPLLGNLLKSVIESLDSSQY